VGYGMTRWVTVRTVKQGWFKFWHDSRRVPRKVWQRWAGSLALGLGLCAVATFAISIAAKGYTNQGLQAWDEQLLPILADQLPLSFSRAITWESPGNLLGMLPVVVVFMGIMAARSQPLLVATMIAAYGLQFALVWIGWGYWNRNRPDLIADGVAASGLHSFPSGHIVVVITVYGLLTYLWCRASPSQMERAIIVLTMTLWIGLITSSRLVLGAHWPSDIIAGIVIGVMWLAVVIVAVHRVEDAL